MRSEDLTCEDSEADEVARTLPPDVATAGEDDDADEGSPPAGEHQPLVFLDVTRAGNQSGHFRNAVLMRGNWRIWEKREHTYLLMGFTYMKRAMMAPVTRSWHMRME